MSDLLRISNGGQAPTPGRTGEAPVLNWITFDRQGTGTLFYALRLRYARPNPDAMDQGFTLERRYRLQGSKSDATSFKAGDLISVTLRVRNTKERRFVAISDPRYSGEYLALTLPN